LGAARRFASRRRACCVLVRHFRCGVGSCRRLGRLVRKRVDDLHTVRDAFGIHKSRIPKVEEVNNQLSPQLVLKDVVTTVLAKPQACVGELRVCVDWMTSHMSVPHHHEYFLFIIHIFEIIKLAVGQRRGPLLRVVRVVRVVRSLVGAHGKVLWQG